MPFMYAFLYSVSLFYRAVWMNVPGLIVIVTLCCLDGLVIFAVYSGCDLIKAGKITSNDQVMTSYQQWPGNDQ